MNFKVVLLLTVSLFSNIHCLKVNSDGGYSDIVIRIEDELQHQDCSAVLENLQNFVRLASEALSSALSGWLEMIGVKIFYALIRKYLVCKKIFYG